MMPEQPPLRSTMLGVAALCFPNVVSRLVAHERYFLDAQTIGASKQEAERVLAEVVTELATTGAPGDAHTIAYRRLLDAGAGIARPPEAVRALARRALLTEGASLHPEDVDRTARNLMRLAEDWSPDA